MNHATQVFALVALVALGSRSDVTPIPTSTLRVSELTGLVSDASGTLIEGAEATLPALSKSTLTNERGEFRFGDVPTGSHLLRVRRLGFQEYTDRVTVGEGVTPLQKVVLLKVPTLQPVEVTADPVMADFDENRRIGLGKFLTRAELESQEHRKLSEILEQVGARAVRVGAQAWIGSSRGGTRKLVNTQCDKRLEGAMGFQEAQLRALRCGCFAQVYLDGVLIYGGDERQPVPDINRILPQSLEAIEFYRSAAQTPLKYSRLNSQCGVLVLHTRRSPGAAKKP